MKEKMLLFKIDCYGKLCEVMLFIINRCIKVSNWTLKARKDIYFEMTGREI